MITSLPLPEGGRSRLLRPGDAIDVWVVERPLGHGGSGSVYRCHNASAPRIVAAVKVLDASLCRSEEAKARFVLEAEIVYGLDHPNIVKLRNVRMDARMPYLEMELVEGVDLGRCLQHGPLPIPDALGLFDQVADALAYVHRQGVCHRDLKPGNILVRPDGTVKIVDFGIATESTGTRTSASENAFGSIGYVPPEWLSPSTLDEVRWDIYSAGVVFWEVLTGREAFPVRGGAILTHEVIRILNEKQRTEALTLHGFPDDLAALVADMTRCVAIRRLGSFEGVQRRLLAVREELERVTRSPAPARVHVPNTPAPHGHALHGHAPPGAPPAPEPEPEPHVTLVPAARAPTWRSSLPNATPPRGDDPSYAVARTRTTTWIEVRFDAGARFAQWCGAQLLNYTLVLPAGPDVPVRGPIRILLSHDDVQIDCAAHVHAAGATTVSYRLELSALQVEYLRRWLRRAS